MSDRAEFLRSLDPYLQMAKAEIFRAYATCKDPFIAPEYVVNLRHLIPDGKGTCDLIIATEKELFVADLKYGTGHRVSAVDNSQLRLYALGAIHRKFPLFGFDQVRLAISQPRLDWYEEEILSVEALLQWGREVVAPTATVAFAGEGAFAAGSHCKFCRARHGCRERARHALDAVRNVFTPAPEIQL